jgi:phage terminase small subunit
MPRGRPRKPLKLLKKHLTKSEKKERKDLEVKTGTKKLVAPDYIKNNLVAYKKWQEIQLIYKGTDLISSGDVGMLARYCMTFSEYLRLCETRDRLGNLSSNWDKYQDVFPEEFQEAVEDALRLNADLQLESAINKKLEILLKMEDRSFLNPLAKIKNIPKPDPKPKKTELDKRGFGNV